MYQINPLPNQVSSEDLALLRQAEPATIGRLSVERVFACGYSRAVLDRAIAAAIVAQS